MTEVWRAPKLLTLREVCLFSLNSIHKTVKKNSAQKCVVRLNLITFAKY